MDYQFRPIEHWPGKFTTGRRSSPFRAKHSDTLALLAKELGFLRARNVVIQAAVGENEIRRDGMLYERARPLHPGIILSFESKHGPLSYPCDTYTDWQANLRAIALSLEALRSVDRYGVTKRAEQYQGWAKLPGPKPESPINQAEAIDVLASAANCSPSHVHKQTLEVVYRNACRRTHPDVGGNAEEFKRVQAAKETLDRYWSTSA